MAAARKAKAADLEALRWVGFAEFKRLTGFGRTIARQEMKRLGAKQPSGIRRLQLPAAVVAQYLASLMDRGTWNSTSDTAGGTQPSGSRFQAANENANASPPASILKGPKAPEPGSSPEPEPSPSPSDEPILKTESHTDSLKRLLVKRREKQQKKKPRS